MIPDVRFTPNPNDAPAARWSKGRTGNADSLRLDSADPVQHSDGDPRLRWAGIPAVPTALGIGQYTLYADLPTSGGLYATANVTYSGDTIGKVTAVEPTETGARATMSIGNRYQIPVDASANVHSVSAVGEQYLDLVSTGNPGNTSRRADHHPGHVPARSARRWTPPSGLAALPKEKIGQLLDETAQALGGLGPALQHLVDATQAIAGDFKANISDINDIIENAAPIIDSQVDSGDAIERWSRNLDVLAAQAAADQHVQRMIYQAAPTDQVNSVFSDVRESLPQTLANLEVVSDAQALPQGRRANPGVPAAKRCGRRNDNVAVRRLGGARIALTINQPPPCFTGFLPASQWRSPADTTRHCRPEPIAKFRKTFRATWFVVPATIRALTFLESGLPVPKSAGTTSRTSR